MTTEKIPDVIWASDLGGWVTRKRDPNHGKLFPKYLRAEPVEELLKQARNLLGEFKADCNEDFESLADRTITAIDKFIGGE